MYVLYSISYVVDTTSNRTRSDRLRRDLPPPPPEWPLSRAIVGSHPAEEKKENNHVETMEFCIQQFFVVPQNFYATPRTFSTCQHGWPQKHTDKSRWQLKKGLFLLGKQGHHFFPPIAQTLQLEGHMYMAVFTLF